ncbi:MAG TPA: hypothetical protein DER01_10095 [Phycisphaerales bacterium]|nr:hypothetical protein [Phycisphaerales bacterium]
MQRNNPKPDHFAFTLIELLVVISIVALLISILLPALGKARETAVMIKCLSNLKSQGVGFYAYTTDHNGSFPFKIDANKINGRQGGTYEWLLAPYLGGQRGKTYKDGHFSGNNKLLTAMICPGSGITHPRTNQTYGLYIHGGPDYVAQNGYQSALGLHYYSGGDQSRLYNGNPAAASLPVDYYSRPNGLPLQYCSQYKWNSNYSDAANGGDAGRGDKQHTSWHFRKKRHTRPTLFLDGHAKALGGERYVAGIEDYSTNYHDVAMSHGNFTDYQVRSGTGGNNRFDFWIEEF